MRVTQHFHHGLVLGMTQQEENKFRETHWNIFGVFGFLKASKQKSEKQKREKLFTRENSQQAKEEQGNLFGFSF